MRRGSGMAAVLVAMTLARARTLDAMEHVGLSQTDRFLLCAGQLFGKPVFRARGGLRGSTEIAIPCGASRERLLGELKGSGTYVAPEEVIVIDNPDVVVLFSAGLYSRANAWVQWRRLLTPISTENWIGIDDSRPLSEAERSDVSQRILAGVRTVPLAIPSVPGKDGETAVLEIMLYLNAHALKAGDVESVIAVLGQTGGIGRLVYGELPSGKYVALWDSPLFNFRTPQLSYRDVNADGVKEIVLTATVGFGHSVMTQVHIWDRTGRELTRQETCEIAPEDGYTIAGGTCPITAERVEFDVRPNGEIDILAWGRREDDPDIVSNRTPFRYRLVEGRYIGARESVPTEDATR